MFVTRIRRTISFIKTFSFTLALISLFVCGVSVSSAIAKPLSKKECKVLKTKLGSLKTTPAVINMTKGFEWVKENMKGDDLLPIKEYIETQEQYKFRCPQPKKKKTPKPKPKKTDNKKELVETDKNSKTKKNPTKKKSVKKKKEKSSLEKQKKSEPTLFETIFPSSVENKDKS